ncbi:MAG: thiol oxidoreductase-like protein [Planctomycetes bacterium]|nr:thiol oxidoreductase-like protein [Planctomycetota bacterium]
MKHASSSFRTAGSIAAIVITASVSSAQLTDVTQTPNLLNVGIKKSLLQEIGPGRGDVYTPGASLYLIERDPFRSIARGRQLFQRKFTQAQGLGPRKNDGLGDIHADPAVGAGLGDSCASCHSRPFGSAGVGGNVFTRPEGRDTPHLFGLGLKEMLADEITQKLRAQRAAAIADAANSGHDETVRLGAKGISYGLLTAHPDGTVDTSAVKGVDADLRVRPFFAQGKTVSIREFAVGAFKAELGLEAADSDLLSASSATDVTTPARMLLSGTQDTFEAPPVSSSLQDGDSDGVTDELPTSLVDHMEFYLLNYFKPAAGPMTSATQQGLATMRAIGCTQCHIPDLTIEHDRRVADVETTFDPANGNLYNRLYAVAKPLYVEVDDGSGLPTLKQPRRQPFVVERIFTDLRRHDLGIAFHERNFDGSVTTQFMTTPLWGVGSTAPYGHDGRSTTLEDVILRHGGEAQSQRDAFEQLAPAQKQELLAFLGALVLFAPPDTASNLAPAQKLDPLYPLEKHGSIDLSVLFLDPSDKE